MSPQTDTARGYVKGQPRAYLHGHHLRQLSGPKNPRWKGGRAANARYPSVLRREHAKADRGGHVREHILVAEAALGKPLPPGAEVHHFNGDTTDNRPRNLVICEDRAYHRLLHRRQQALAECGHAGWLRCTYCGKLDDPMRLSVLHLRRKGGVWTRAYHRECNARTARERRARQREGDV